MAHWTIYIQLHPFTSIYFDDRMIFRTFLHSYVKWQGASQGTGQRCIDAIEASRSKQSQQVILQDLRLGAPNQVQFFNVWSFLNIFHRTNGYRTCKRSPNLRATIVFFFFKVPQTWKFNEIQINICDVSPLSWCFAVWTPWWLPWSWPGTKWPAR